MKFKYDYLNNQLTILNPDTEYSHEIPEESKFVANFGGEGFSLGESNWITFNIYDKKIKVFAKLFQDGEVTYYRKEISIIPLSQLPLVVPNFAREINFELGEEDIVVKNEKGWWIPKQ
ncbi:MAG: hypothetical protein MRERV_1c138 [Mycoplasmataceae bacterium RV_VA103A]|nr:MAG: hypothetical protein MRERV_1c138 [Mycoplasmataceae bacterium RV_VA103A]